MTTQEMLLKQKLSLLELASQLKNISKACAVFHVSRQHYYDIKEAFEKAGVDGLKEKVRRSPNMPNKTPELLEKQIVDFSIDHPTMGKERVALELKMKGVFITHGGVEKIWKRHHMPTKKERIKLLEEKVVKTGFFISEDQIAALMEHAALLEERHLFSSFPGYILCQDTFEVGYIKKIGRIYLQVIVDSFGSFAFARLYNSKSAISAADILLNSVIPFYRAFGRSINRILTDNGSEYRGTKENHEYEILLDIFNIKHKLTHVRNPNTNGFAERFNRTIFEEFFISAFRTKWYNSIDELQHDINDWLVYYNFHRPHQGYRTKGKTPAQLFLDFSFCQPMLPAPS